MRKELLYRRRFSVRIIRFYATAEGLVDALLEAQVAADTAKAYAARMADGGAVLLVLAGHRPLRVAQTTRDVTADMGAVDMGGLIEEVTVPDEKRPTLSVMRGHPHMMTRRRDPYATNFHMADWPIPLISRRKPFSEMLFDPHARMADFPLPLISRRKPYTGSAIAPHARMANFPIPLISRRKPYTGTMIGRHTRMANWPFPHLINGKSDNSLIPGGPRMANFPISLLSVRKPYTGSAIAPHARMANFPIPLISRRKPYTGSMFPRHARMADAILPLVIKDSKKVQMPEGRGFSLSRFLGMPTVIRR